MKNKYILFVLLSFGLTSCNNSDNAAATVVAEWNINGTYKVTGINCYDTGSNLTQYGTLDSSASVEFTIDGSTYTETITDSDCTAVLSSSVTFNPNGTYAITDMDVTSATGGSCQTNLVINEKSAGFGSLSQNPINTTHSTSTPSFSSTAKYIENENLNSVSLEYVGLNVTGSATDVCYMAGVKKN